MKLVVWLLIAVGVIYGFYTGFMAIWTYTEVKWAAEETVREKARGEAFGRADRVRAEFLKKLGEAGVGIDGQHVYVGEEDRTLRVFVRWTQTLVAYQGQAVLEIPLTYDASFAVPDR